MKPYVWTGRESKDRPTTPFYERLLLAPLRDVPAAEYEAEISRIMKKTGCPRSEAETAIKDFERMLPGFREG